MPISRPPSTRSVSILALPSTVDSEVFATDPIHEEKVAFSDRLDDLSAKLTSIFYEESDKVAQRLDGMGQSFDDDRLEIKEMLMELLVHARKQDMMFERADHLDRSVAARSVASLSPSVAHRAEFAASPIRAAYVECSTSPTRMLSKDCATSPLASQNKNIGVSPPRKRTASAILLTPPPRHALSPDSLLETMSYLSSHHSDDLSEVDVELAPDQLQVERVSPAWSTTSPSRASTAMSESSEGEEEGKEPVFAQSPKLPSAVEHLVVRKADMGVQAHRSVANESIMAQSTRTQTAILPEDLAEGSVHSENMSSLAGIAVQGLPLHKDIQMPMPVRAGPPFEGQLADMITFKAASVHEFESNVGFESFQKVAHVSLGTSPILQPITSISVQAVSDSVEKGVDFTIPSPPVIQREEKGVCASPPPVRLYSDKDCHAVDLQEKREASSQYTPNLKSLTMTGQDVVRLAYPPLYAV